MAPVLTAEWPPANREEIEELKELLARAFLRTLDEQLKERIIENKELMKDNVELTEANKVLEAMVKKLEASLRQNRGELLPAAQVTLKRRDAINVRQQDNREELMKGDKKFPLMEVYFLVGTWSARGLKSYHYSENCNSLQGKEEDCNGKVISKVKESCEKRTVSKLTENGYKPCTTKSCMAHVNAARARAEAKQKKVAV